MLEFCAFEFVVVLFYFIYRSFIYASDSMDKEMME